MSPAIGVLLLTTDNWQLITDSFLMTQKSLDIKLAKIKANPAGRDFILADAKDADMAWGIAAPGKSPEHYAQEGKFRTLAEFRQCIRDVVHQGLVDIMLMSAHTSGILTIEERLYSTTRTLPRPPGPTIRPTST